MSILVGIKAKEAKNEVVCRVQGMIMLVRGIGVHVTVLSIRVMETMMLLFPPCREAASPRRELGNASRVRECAPRDRRE